MKRKGVSEVIALIFLVLITIVAAGIVYQFAIPFVRDNLNSSTDCLKLKDSVKFDNSFGFNCVKDDDYLISLSLDLDPSYDLSIEGLEIIFLSLNGESKKVDIFEMQSYGGDFPEMPKNGETRTYKYNSRESFENAAIMIRTGSGQICKVDKEVFLKECE